MAKRPGGMGELFRQAQQMQKKMAELQAGLKDLVVEGSAGGGMVKVTVNGSREVVAVKIDPEVVDPKDVGMLEDLVLLAANQGLKKSQDMIKEEMSRIAGGVDLPGIF